MKKTLLLIAAILISSLTIAQQGPRSEESGKRGKERMENLTPEQRADLKSKRLTLHLNLSDAQQKSAREIILEQEIKRDAFRKDKKANKELSEEEKFQKMEDRLNTEIEMKRKWKEVLTEEQFERFEKMKFRSKRNKRGKERKSRS